MTNFDFLKTDKQFEVFADAAIAAEKIFNVSAENSAFACRRAMELAVKWMYSVDSALVMPYQDKLVSLLSTEEFRDIVGPDLLYRLNYIRKLGNNSAHSSQKIKKDEAALALENLYIFLDFVAYCYGKNYTEGRFNKQLLAEQQSAAAYKDVPDVDLKRLIEENKSLKDQLTERRTVQQKTYANNSLENTEFVTRKKYIDVMLRDADWIEGKNWINEYEIFGMPNKSGVGYADYVLLGDDGKPLAVVEAKNTCTDVAVGRQQAKLYAELLEEKYGQRPVIFLTNGFETRIWNSKYENERKVAAFYSKRDLMKLFSLERNRLSLDNIMVNKAIAGRYYQEGAVKAVCDSFGKRNRRTALLVMATGSGKTRTVISLVDVLLQRGWIKNVLFLADRNSLVTQAKRSFVNLLPNLSVVNLCEDKDNVSARCVFSTYQTMMQCIDDTRDSDGRLFTCGHFDLVICDEAHRSIYNKYRDIFNYFDARLVGLTATPKEDDKNTYEAFELENGVPTYGYELAQAVKDGYLVDYNSIETNLKFLTNGIVYDDLTEAEKEKYETLFTDENGDVPEKIASTALNEWIFNEDTIKKVLNTLMTEGIRINYGEKLGKTIIFAKNHRHAEKIYEVFNKEYPELVDYARVIDNYTNYVQSAIDEFSDPRKMPQIAISVDMLDTGIDVPEVVNLVFFKKVMSKAKFWQMIGRGTRLCPGLLDDGADKKQFYIFDFCGNFEFFRLNPKGTESASNLALQGAIFNLKAQIAFKLQSIEYQTDELKAFRQQLVKDMLDKVQQLNKDNFAVKQHLRSVEKYSVAEGYQALDYADTLVMADELAPLILPDKDEVSAVRFDALIYGVELAYLAGKPYKRAHNDIVKRVRAVADVANIPEIMEQADLINKILHTDYLETATVNDFEYIRENLRYLMKYIPNNTVKYDTNFSDDILSVKWHDSNLENDDLKNYKLKAEYYIRQNAQNRVIGKIKRNIKLTKDDVHELEKILWSEVGSKEDYEREYGHKPLGELVREINGLDMNAAKEAFSQYLNEANFDSRQIYFVNQIVEYIVQNGMMKDMSVLQSTPFSDQGSIVEVFPDLSVWNGIRTVINEINSNAWAA